ncbi:MAG: branched-chain amino acid ABC transporter permease [bacterium]
MNVWLKSKMIVKSYLLPTAWIFLISVPIMGVTKSIFVAGGIFVALLVFNFFKNGKAKPFISNRFMDNINTSVVKYIWLVVLIISIVVPLFLNSYSLDIFTSVLFYIMLALGLNLLVGELGLLNLGYIAFYGIGAYTYAILYSKFNVGFWGALLLGGGVSALVSLFIAIPTLRLKGDYLAIATLGFGEIIRMILNNWNSLTNGPNGIMNIPRPSLFDFQLSSGIRFFYLTLFFVVLEVYIVYRLKQSRFGRYAVAIRENEQASEMIGINAYKIKTEYFMLSAFIGGVAGVLFASKQMFVSPDSFTFIESVYVLAMVILGGMGNIPGVILGAVTLVVLPEVLRGFVVYRMLVFAIILIVLMIFRPEGLLGKKA